MQRLKLIYLGQGAIAVGRSPRSRTKTSGAPRYSLCLASGALWAKIARYRHVKNWQIEWRSSDWLPLSCCRWRKRVEVFNFMIYGWTPGIGDPDVIGWLTAVSYFFAAAACLRASGRGAPEIGVSWRRYAVILVLLGINKQLDLQSLMTAIGRHVAISEGWYDHRRLVQQKFVLIVGIAGLCAALLLSRSVPRNGAQLRLATGGIVLLITFIIIRAASFHHVDAALQSTLAGVRFNHFLEIGGIAVVGFAAWRSWMAKKMLETADNRNDALNS